MKTQNLEIELMEEDLQSQIISQDIQCNCPCKCHPRALSCVRCNEAFHRIPISRHRPEDKRLTKNGVVYYIV